MPSNVLNVQNELKAYLKLCAENRFKPAKEDFDDIVKFILLYQNGGVTLTESVVTEDDSTFNYLYENFIEKLNESDEYLASDEGDAFKVAVGTAEKIGAGLAVGGALAAVYVAFLFKKGKLKASLDKEHKLEMEKIAMFDKVVKLQVKLAEMEDKDVPELGNIIPTMSSPTKEIEKPERPGASKD